MPKTKAKIQHKPNKVSKQNKTMKASALTSVMGSGSKSSPSLGSILGSKAGSLLGAGAGKLFGKILGFGDYSLTNSIIEPKSVNNSVPVMHTTGHVTRITNREFIRDISTATTALPAFNVLTVNASSSITFPWLSTVASCYQEYKFLGLVFEYIPTSGNAISSTNAALGSITFAARYNVLALAPSTKSQIANAFFATSGSPADKQFIPIECAPAEAPCQVYFTRFANQVLPGDPRFESFCLLDWLSTGSQSVFTGGELHVSYDVLLLKPRLSSAVTPAARVYNLETDDQKEIEESNNLSVAEGYLKHTTRADSF